MKASLNRLGAGILTTGLALAAWAAPPPVGLTEVVSGLSSPVEIARAPGSPNRMFVVEQGGRIRILENGAILPADFLDASGLIVNGGERGLLGLAFHPDYATNRAFYVFYTRSADGALTIARYLRDAANPDIADAASGLPILIIGHPNGNHNGGRLVFGPDGYLYIGIGDGGGSGGDPDRHGQDQSVVLGKILRIAVDGLTGYTIPPTNPYAGSSCGAGQCPEILHYGLRNPWKFSFDAMNGDLYIADVGHGTFEEVSRLSAGAVGGNLGWGIFEGTMCFNDNYFGVPGACAGLSTRVDPVITYAHNASGGFSITGGHVYRGAAIPALTGYYVYGDFVSRRIWAARNAGAFWEVNVLLPPPVGVASISSFGETAAGELLLADYDNGKIWRIDPAAPPPKTAFDHSGDSRADIFWRNNASGLDYQWHMNGLAIVAQDALPAVPTSWTIAGIGDLDGDGRADAFWREASTGKNYAWMLGGFSITNQGALPLVSAPWAVAGLGDANGDGRADVFWRNPATGQNYLWIMNGPSVVAQAFLPTVSGGDWTIAAVADLNADGRADVLWRNGSTGQNYAWLMNGFAISAQGFLPGAPAGWMVAGTPDANADGRADVLWRHAGTGQNYLWLMNGLTISSQGFLPAVADTNWAIAGYGDYDGDGRGDVLWRNSATGANYLWMLDGFTITSQGFLASVGDTNWQPIRK